MISLLNSEEVVQNWDTLKKLLHYCREVGSNVFLPDSYYENKLKDLIVYLKNDKAYFWVVQEDETIVGFLWACEIERDTGRVFHILHLAVLDSYQKKGYGKRLIEAAQTQAKMKKIDKIELNVQVSNKKAIDFYKKNAFYDDHITMRLDLE